MKHYTIAFCTSLLLAACHSAQNKTTTSEEPKKDAPTIVASSTTTTPGMDQATMMKNWKAYMTPGKEHQMMTSWNGTWLGDVSMWEGPNAQPAKSAITSVNRMVLGGRYQLSEEKGQFMGMSFEGRGTLAYDNIKRKFISTWIDNMGTGLITLEGPWDEGNKSMDLKGKEINPQTGDEMTVRQVFRVIDNDRQIIQMFQPGPDGKEFKSMEILLTRRK